MANHVYRRADAVQYAAKWAHSRNPKFYNFDNDGGDCTNFISQCLLAGGAFMNYTRDVGWYYNSPTDRAAAWSGVPYLYNFLTKNKGRGPYALEAPIQSLEVADIIQLGNGKGHWYHSLLITGFQDGVPLVSTHSFDAHIRPLNSYVYSQARGLHIDGIRESFI